MGLVVVPPPVSTLGYRGVSRPGGTLEVATEDLTIRLTGVFEKDVRCELILSSQD